MVDCMVLYGMVGDNGGRLYGTIITSTNSGTSLARVA